LHIWNTVALLQQKFLLWSIQVIGLLVMVVVVVVVVVTSPSHGSFVQQHVRDRGRRRILLLDNAGTATALVVSFCPWC
jgi:hypothetical protein